jgi:hypothetical protein
MILIKLIIIICLLYIRIIDDLDLTNKIYFIYKYEMNTTNIIRILNGVNLIIKSHRIFKCKSIKMSKFPDQKIKYHQPIFYHENYGTEFLLQKEDEKNNSERLENQKVINENNEQQEMNNVKINEKENQIKHEIQEKIEINHEEMNGKQEKSYVKEEYIKENEKEEIKKEKDLNEKKEIKEEDINEKEEIKEEEEIELNDILKEINLEEKGKREYIESKVPSTPFQRLFQFGSLTTKLMVFPKK